MAEQRQDDQLERTYSISVPIRDVGLKTCNRQWTIGRDGERGSGISMLMVRRNDDDACSYLHFRVVITWEIFCFFSHYPIEYE